MNHKQSISQTNNNKLIAEDRQALARSVTGRDQACVMQRSPEMDSS